MLLNWDVAVASHRVKVNSVFKTLFVPWRHDCHEKDCCTQKNIGAFHACVHGCPKSTRVHKHQRVTHVRWCVAYAYLCGSDKLLRRMDANMRRMRGSSSHAWPSDACVHVCRANTPTHACATEVMIFSKSPEIKVFHYLQYLSIQVIKISPLGAKIELHRFLTLSEL